MNNFDELISSLANLRKSNRYVVVSHFTDAPRELLLRRECDLDILCNNNSTKRKIVKLLSARKIHKYLFSKSYWVQINGIDIPLDLFVVGDGFYPSAWARKMIKNASYQNGFYVLDKESNYYSCLYHQFFHKKNVNEAGLKKLNNFIKEEQKEDYFLAELISFMDKNRYRFTVTLDRRKTNNFKIDYIKSRKSYPLPILIKHVLYYIFVSIPRRLYRCFRKA